MKKRAEIINIGLSVSGANTSKTADQISFEAIDAALKNSELDFEDIDCFLLCEDLPAAGAASFFNNASKNEKFKNKSIYAASYDGLYGLYAANLMITSGACDIIMVVGAGARARKNNFDERNAQDYIAEKVNPFFMAGLEMKKYLAQAFADKEMCAEIISASKEKALNNIRANFGAKISKNQILNSETIFYPLSSMDISPYLAASCAIVVSAPNLIKRENVYIDFISWICDAGESLFDDKNLGYPKHLEENASAAYKALGIKDPLREIDLFELEDSYSFQLLQAIDLIGLSGGKNAFEIFKDQNKKINASGGCIGMGNPLKAKGLMRAAEAVLQLKGGAGSNQIVLSKGRILLEAHDTLPYRCGAAVILSRE